MPTSRSNLGAAIVNGRIYAIGGYIQGMGATNKVEEYDIATDTWTTKANMPTLRQSLGVSACNGKIYAIGGQGGYYSKNEEYTPTIVLTQAPANLIASAGNSIVDLFWDAVSGADSYTVKRSLTEGGPYTVIADGVTDTTYSDTDVVNGTTYYYVVTAVSADGESENSNEASATPQASMTTGKALLVITMTNGLEKEYDMQMSEVNNFIDWYDSKAAGNGQGYYTISKTFNLGPFMNRTDYLTFDKIQNFEVMQYQ